MIFWKVSIVKVLILAICLNFLEYYDVKSIEAYPTESFSQVEILEKELQFEFSKISQKLHGCHGNIKWGLIGGTELFLMENTYKEISQGSYSKLQAVLKICCDLGEGGTKCPLAWIGLIHSFPLPLWLALDSTILLNSWIVRDRHLSCFCLNTI